MIKQVILLGASLLLATALVLNTSVVAAAGPGPGTHGNASVKNPNGPPPIGKPNTTPALGRGHSENAPRSFVGRVTAVRGDIVTLTMPNGIVRTFTLTPTQIASIRNSKRIVLFSNGGVLATQVVPADRTLRGVITNVVSSQSKVFVTIRLPNGKVKTISVAPEAAHNMQLNNGRPVIVSTTSAFTTPVTVRDIIFPRLP